jgi:activator of 2-hydroxyglutaryl-CoA dehydratase
MNYLGIDVGSLTAEFIMLRMLEETDDAGRR